MTVVDLFAGAGGAALGMWDLDAADYGVPQRRHRRFVAGRLNGPCPAAPAPTHSQAALAHAKWVTGSYWLEHGIKPRGEPTRAEIAALRRGDGLDLARWRTVRDVLDLDAIASETNLSGRGIRPRSSDEPGPQPVASGKALGGLLGWVRTEQITAVASTVDEPIGTVPGAGNQYLHATNVGRCERRGKHDPHRLDLPAGTVRSGGDGHSAPSFTVGYLRGRSGGAVMERHSPDEPAQSVRSAAGGSSNGYLETWRLDIPSPAVAATEEKGSGARSVEVSRHGREGRARHGLDRASDMLLLATGRRRLTPEECAVLQDFPADHPWSACGTKSARYRCVGNAVPAALATVVVGSLVGDGP